MAIRDETDEQHDLTRRAIAALKAVMVDEGRLHRVQRVAGGEALDGGDFGAVEGDGEGQAGVDPPVVDQHRAGAALAAVAAFLGAGQGHALAQEVEQGHPRVVERYRPCLAVDGQADGVGHASSIGLHSD